MERQINKEFNAGKNNKVHEATNINDLIEFKESKDNNMIEVGAWKKILKEPKNHRSFRFKKEKFLMN